MGERCIAVFGILAMTTQVCSGCMTTTLNALDAQSTASRITQTCGRFGFATPNSERSCKKMDGQTTGTFGQSFLVTCLIGFSMKDGQLPSRSWNIVSKDPSGLLFRACWWFVRRFMCVSDAGANRSDRFPQRVSPFGSTWIFQTRKKLFVLILILSCTVRLSQLVFGICLRHRLHATTRLRRCRSRRRDRSRCRSLYNRHRDLLLLRSLLLKHLRLNSSAHCASRKI